MLHLSPHKLTYPLTFVHSDKRGINHEVQEEYWQRFEHAFAIEAGEFIDSILNDTPVPLPLKTGIKVMQIARGLQSALWSGEVTRWDENGELLTEDAKEVKPNNGMNVMVKGSTNGHVANGASNGVVNGHR